MSLFEELKRRNVFRVGVAYVLFAWVALQGADFLLDLIDAPNWVIQAMSIAVVIGLPIALVLAWAYELTPDGVKRESEVDRSESVTPQTGRRLDYIIIGVLGLIIVFMIVERLFFARVDTQPAAQNPVVESEPAPADAADEPPSIAVMPFVNMSSDPEQEFFSDGISEEILNQLTRIPDLKVAARTSSFQFKGKTLDVALIGEQLGVNHLLEGSVRSAGDQVRVTAQLIQISDGFHVWSKTFDREMKDIFAIQDEIAMAIAAELQATMNPEALPDSQPVDLEAYELFLKGRALVAMRGVPNLDRGMELLRQALEIEPEFSDAMGSLALAHSVYPYYSMALSTRETYDMAREWATRALALDPENVEALSVMGTLSFMVDYNLEEAERLLRRAVELAPGNATAHNLLGDFYIRTGNIPMAEEHEALALELDPLSPVQWLDLANVALIKGMYEEAIRLGEHALELAPDFANIVTVLRNAYLELGDEQKLVELVEHSGSLPMLQGGSHTSVKIALAQLRGNEQEVEELFTLYREQQEAGLENVVNFAYVAATIGKWDDVAEKLMQAIEDDNGTWMFPMRVRLPEQVPDNEAMQAFWALPGPAAVAELRRKNGLPVDPAPAR